MSVSVVASWWSALALLACVSLAACVEDAGVGGGSGYLLPRKCRVAIAGQLTSYPEIFKKYNDGSSQTTSIEIPGGIGTWVNLVGLRVTVCTLFGDPPLMQTVTYYSLPSHVEVSYLNRPATFPRTWITVEASYGFGPVLPDTVLRLIDIYP